MGLLYCKHNDLLLPYNGDIEHSINEFSFSGISTVGYSTEALELTFPWYLVHIRVFLRNDILFTCTICTYCEKAVLHTEYNIN